MWLQACIEEFEDAIRILIDDDDKDPKYKASCAKLKRGPHMPIIIGYQRQSAKVCLSVVRHSRPAYSLAVAVPDGVA